MYIKTKDTILEVEKIIKNEWINGNMYKADGAYFHEKEILDKSENIEDLFDVTFLLMSLHKPMPIIINVKKSSFCYGYDERANQLSLEDYDIKRGIYGAIWTDHGLKNVAKLNENREWELL